MKIIAFIKDLIKIILHFIEVMSVEEVQRLNPSPNSEFRYVNIMHFRKAFTDFISKYQIEYSDYYEYCKVRETIYAGRNM